MHDNNQTVLDGKCPPGWGAVLDTCYSYIGAPMGFREAKEFCMNDNASMPYMRSDTSPVLAFLEQQRGVANDYSVSAAYDQRVWVQDLDRIDQCTALEYRGIVLDDCQSRHGFICEIDPIVSIDPLLWTTDIVAIGVISSMAIAVLVLALAIACWYHKSRHRHAQRLQRRNSIRQSLRSLNSLDPGSMRRKNLSGSRSTDTLTVKSASDCKRMLSSGSIDSIEKSVFTGSSLDDDRSFDVYESHNPRTGYNGLHSQNVNPFVDSKPRFYGANEFREGGKDYEKPRLGNHYANGGSSLPNANNAPGYELAYRNEGFRDPAAAGSTFGAGKGLKQRPFAANLGIPEVDDSMEHHAGHSDYYNNASTLPLNSTLDKSITESESLNLSQYSDRGLMFFKDASPEDNNKYPPTAEYASAHSTFRAPAKVERDLRLENGLPPAPHYDKTIPKQDNVPQYSRAAPTIPPSPLNYQRAASNVLQNNPNVPENLPIVYHQNLPPPPSNAQQSGVPPAVPPPTYVQINLTYKNPTTLSDGSPLERKVQNFENAPLMSDAESTTSSVPSERRNVQKPAVPQR
ncbi:protein bark beetle-like [Ctenocephalides felis]|uniref:protein bark beetle-like n=2 Tax=Ctenocephalides felis TaxID=7515 RepID=UPI000E6E481D|nr:protein bark beetle-like [Ctenocephalides felis]